MTHDSGDPAPPATTETESAAPDSTARESTGRESAGRPMQAAELGQMRRMAQPRPQARGRRRRGMPLLLLKIVLPTIAALTVGYLTYWWWVHASEQVITVEKMQQMGEDTKAAVVLNDVKFDGKDDKGRPYSITAESASHADGDERHIALKKPLADIIMGSGAYVAVTALEGVMDRDSDIVTLTGDVTLFHDNGLSFQTDSATIDLKEKTAEGSEPVEGQNQDGEVIAQGFKVLDDGNTIEFTGKAYMKIYPKQKGQGE